LKTKRKNKGELPNMNGSPSKTSWANKLRLS
jgi:hypothetical protein